MQTREIDKIQEAELVAGSLDLGIFTLIFSMFLKDTWKKLFMESWRYFLFPISASISVVQAVLAWRKTQIDKNINNSYKSNLFTNAVLTTASSAVVISALLISFVFTTVSAIVAPILFTTVTAIRGLFHAGSAFFYWGKSAFANTQATKAETNEDGVAAIELFKKADEYRTKAYTNAINATASILSSGAIFSVMILAKSIFAIMGLVGGGFGALNLIYATYEMIKPRPQDQGYGQVPNEEPDANANLVPNANTVVPQVQRRRSRTAEIHQAMHINPLSSAAAPDLAAEAPSPAATEPDPAANASATSLLGMDVNIDYQHRPQSP
jgi:hypothetical protein